MSFEEGTTSEVPHQVEITLPEGMDIDESLLTEYREMATNLKLDNEQASKLAEWYVNEQAKASEAVQQTKIEQGQKWIQSLRNDPDLGGTDENWKSSLKAVKTALRKYASEPEVEAIQAAGLANYPPLVRIMHRVGAAFKEDSLGNTGAKPNTQLTRDQKLKAMYPSMFPSE